MKILLVAVLLLVAVSAVFSLQDSEAIIRSDNITDYRLPNNSVPISYKINLIPYIVVDNFTYDGESTIELEVLESSSSITLHILALTIDESSTSLVSSSNTEYAVANHTYDITKEFLILNFATNLPIGNYTLYLKYEGILNGSALLGFYTSSYINDNGETIWLATTQFEPTSARRAFPCWDEPAIKATFTISIKHYSNYTALSNMPVASQSAIDTTDRKLWTTFETTPIMPVYSVAFVVSDFGYVSNENDTFRVWSRKNVLNNTAYALAHGESVLRYLEEYTMIPLALPKVDQIAIPDFIFLAMENWGLITYSETELLYEEGVSTTLFKQAVALLVAHEFTHQWFGNLVTPYWWTYTWLNEGFAAYFEYYITDEIEDNWRLMEQFVIKRIQGNIFLLDSTENTHPLNQDASTPEEIISFFDVISYYKGAAVIRMMSHNILTPAGLRAGLTKYLNNHAYGAVTTDDLWSALQEVSEENGILQTPVSIKTVMDTWAIQGGYPVITVIRNYTNETATISQERYFEPAASDDGTRWFVPISYTTQHALDFSSTLATEWIRQQDDSIIISGFVPTEWTIFNIQQSGYYRVNYDYTNWKLLATYLDSENYDNIHVLNRAQLIDNSHHLARVNRISFSVFLDLSVYLRREIDYIVWYTTMNALDYLRWTLGNTESMPLFERFFLERLEYCLASVGYYERDDDGHVIKFHRANVISWSCNLGSTECRSNATARVIANLEDPVANPISTDLTYQMYCAGLRSANATVWNKVLDLYVQSPSTTILAYLGCSEDEEILENYLTLATTDNSIILDDHAFTAYTSVSNNGSPRNINFALDYFINNFERLYTFWNGSTSEITAILIDLGGKITLREQLDKLEALIEEQSDLLGSTGSSTIAIAESNIEWTDTYEPTFRRWFHIFYTMNNENTTQRECF